MDQNQRLPYCYEHVCQGGPQTNIKTCKIEILKEYELICAKCKVPCCWGPDLTSGLCRVIILISSVIRVIFRSIFLKQTHDQYFRPNFG